jgi:hypothetical protein
MATVTKLALNLALALTAVTSFNLPSSAMTLNGHLEERNVVSQENQNSRPVGGLPNFQPTASDLNPNTFPKAFQGSWACQTTVTDSNAAAVTIGQTIDSDVTFYPTTDGRIQARWNQPGWVETQAIAYSFGKNCSQAKSDRTTYYFGDNAQGSWAARARDQFAQTTPDTITATSYVDQYIDGQYAGRYRTQSVLKRTTNDWTIANR